MSQVVLIDYGSGNLRSAEKALQEAARASGADARIVTTDDPETVAAADRLVLPGVGAFAACMRALSARPGLIEAMTENARDKGRPFLGVCVGMQLLATRGLEFGETAGLDWIAGDVRLIEPKDHALKVPHMGWNVLTDIRPHPLLSGEAEQTHMYFTHSFAFDAASAADVIARFDHGGQHAAAVAHGNIAGVQFHPEKSQAAGLQLLANFLEWRP
jgi:imidazole glycerol-phosphate synthase subunit HisH